MGKTTTIINLFGGPGAGKTTCAWEIAAELKKKGFVTEYVSEYAKELVWNGENEKLDGSLKNQKMLYEEQKHRIDRLIGKVDFIVTDSPTLLSISYLKEPNKEFTDKISREFKENNNFCMIVQRGNVFEKEGRVHNLEQSKQLDAEIQQLLSDERIPFGVYHHHTIDVSISNMIRVHWGHGREAESKSLEEPGKSSLDSQIKAASSRSAEHQASSKEKICEMVL